MSGELYIIATPVGNLGDLTRRVAETLERCDLILAEDTRVTIKILNHLDIKKKLVSCHDFNEEARTACLEEASAEGKKIAVVSDAGTPLISDPGYLLVRRAIELGMKVIPLPGPSAFILALVGSGLPCDRFVFEGFLPGRKSDRRKRLEELKKETRTLVFYVAPHDLLKILEQIREIWGDRPACVAREITKLHEEFLRGRISYLAGRFAERQIRGEFVLVVGGADKAESRPADKSVILKELECGLARGERLSRLAGSLAKSYGWSKSDVYDLGVGLKKDDIK